MIKLTPAQLTEQLVRVTPLPIGGDRYHTVFLTLKSKDGKTDQIALTAKAHRAIEKALNQMVSEAV